MVLLKTTMIEVRPSNTVTSDHKIKNTRVSKCLKVFFIILHITFGLDFGFIKCDKTQQTFIVKLLIAACIVIVNFECFVLLINEPKSVKSLNLWYIKYLTENISYIVILMVIPQQKSFSNFIKNLESIDSKLGLYPSRYFCFKIITWCLLSLTFNFIATVIYCFLYGECAVNPWSHIVLSIPFMSMDLPFIVIFFTFHLVCYRLVFIQKCIQNKKFEAIELQRIYKTLVDLTESVKKSFDPMVIITLIFNVPSVMVVIYDTLSEVKMNMISSDEFVMKCFSIVFLMIVILAPSIAASSLPSEVDTIRITLHNSLLEENDQKKSQDIQRFINYTEARSLKFYVLKIVPFDATLPVIIINLCITYLIVILQLTHIY